MKRRIELETGKFYWFRHKVEMIWRPCYIGQDPDDNQWLYRMGVNPMRISKMGLTCFDWRPLEQPKD